MSLRFARENANNNPQPFDKLARCEASYVNQCPKSMPYICTDTNGLYPRGGCTSDPNIFQRSLTCDRFCDTRMPPNVVTVPPKPMYLGLRKPQTHPGFESYLPTHDISKKVICPLGVERVCGQAAPFQCLEGDAINGCAPNELSWNNSPACKKYCDIRTEAPVPPPIPPPKSKLIKCPADIYKLCDVAARFQCLEGRAINGCAANKSVWDESDACVRYCDTAEGIIPGPGPVPEPPKPPKIQRNIRVTNKCPKKIWVGAFGPKFTPANGGFELEANSTKTIQVPSDWNSGRLWPRTGCIQGSDGQLRCETGDCNGQFGCKVTGEPPASLAEFTLSPTGADYYDVSLVDGYNIPISITPIEGTYQRVNNPDLGKFNCGNPGCKPFDMSQCPPELTMKGKDGTYCASICTAVHNPHKVNDPGYIRDFDKDLVCCSCNCGPNCGCEDPRCKFGCSPLDKGPIRRGGSCYLEKWPKASTGKNYSEVFKNQCPDAYSWQFDDISSTYQCVNADYDVTFC